MSREITSENFLMTTIIFIFLTIIMHYDDSRHKKKETSVIKLVISKLTKQFSFLPLSAQQYLFYVANFYMEVI